MHTWRKGIASWQAGNIIYLSIPFTWLVHEAISMVKKSKKKVVVGGPGAMLMRDKFDSIAEVREDAYPFEPIIYHNPFATFTTRGCPNRCPYCAVPKIEGSFREISDFIPRPIVCDNNFLASNKKHFNKVIDALKVFPYVDFNQGLEARKFTSEKADKFAELKHIKIRFAFDRPKDESFVIDAINLARKKGLNDISCYILFGFKDTPKEILYRVKVLRKLKVQLYPMRYEPLDAEKQGEYINTNKGWTDYELKRLKRYYRGQGLFKCSFEGYDHRKEYPEGFGLVKGLKDGREERWGKE